MRDYDGLRRYAESLDARGEAIVIDRIRQGSLDYDITLTQALAMEVHAYGRVGKLRTLGWIAENKPGMLECLMQTVEPGSVVFAAIVLVYNANVDAAVKDANKRNERMRGAGMDGLARSKKMKVRPTRMWVRATSRMRVRGKHRQLSGELVALIRQMTADGASTATVARATGLRKSTVNVHRRRSASQHSPE